MTEEGHTPEVPTASAVLKKGRLKPVYAGHPWIFSGAIQTVDGDPNPGDPIWVLNPNGARIGWGLYNPSSTLRIRFWGFETSDKTAVFSKILRQRIVTAKQRRDSLGLPSGDTNAYRIIHGEGDLVPGCTVDILGEAIVIRYGSLGLWQRKEIVAQILSEEMPCTQIAQIVDPQVAADEEIYGINQIRGEPDLEKCPVSFIEEGIHYESDLLNAQKSGHYADQRANRMQVRALSQGRRVLDLCTYTGGFALNAAKGGAKSVMAVDSSGPAIKIAQKNAAKNGFEQITFVHEDMMRVMNAQENNSFDMVILDPPKLIKSRNHREQGEKKYISLNTRAMQMVAQGGVFLSFSCSGVFDQTRFLRMLSQAAMAADRRFYVHTNLDAGWDHPYMVQAPESRYLKGVLGFIEPR